MKSGLKEMNASSNIYVLGCGAVGLTLAAYLAEAGRNVIAVRTSTPVCSDKVTITVNNEVSPLSKISVQTEPLSSLTTLDGLVVVSAKSYANAAIATSLAGKKVRGALVIMQNGIGIETQFFDSAFEQIYRCVLYTTTQVSAENEVTFRSITSSPIGVMKGQEAGLAQCVTALSTQGFPFHSEKNIHFQIWKKAIINSVFNSICPLLDVDNGIFYRDPSVADLAREIVNECVILANASGVSLTESVLMDQILRISKGSDGIMISTLQDIRNGRKTEIESLNLELARIASTLNPEIRLTTTRFLGKMILSKSAHNA